MSFLRTARRTPPSCAPYSLDLGHGIELACWAPSESGALRVRFSFAGRVVMERSFTARRPQPQPWPLRARIVGPTRGRWQVALPLVRADVAIVIDVFSVEARISAHLAVPSPLRSRPRAWRQSRAWMQVDDAREATVVRFAPSVGRIGAPPCTHLWSMTLWGRSLPCSPAVLRFFVDDDRRAMAAGWQSGTCSPSTRRLCSTPSPASVVILASRTGRYNDPDSPWFNVFFGYYQIDCAKAAWSRPFAYRSGAGAESVVIADELVRLGLADWIWFSNWMYGLPEDVAVRYSSAGAHRATVSDQEVHQIGRRRWHRVRLEGVEVASCQEGEGSGARRLARNTPLSAIWRRSFGPARRRPQWPQSFAPVTLEAVSDLCYWEDDEEFHTIVFGATARAGTDPAFLQTQLSALRAVIETSYPGLGFPLGEELLGERVTRATSSRLAAVHSETGELGGTR